jgi:hypothetical protein
MLSPLDAKVRTKDSVQAQVGQLDVDRAGSATHVPPEIRQHASCVRVALTNADVPLLAPQLVQEIQNLL